MTSVLSREPGDSPKIAANIAHWLTGIVSERGAVGRDVVDYLFDTSIVLSGLIACRDSCDSTDLDAPIAKLTGFLTDCVDHGRAVVANRPIESRWSTRIGCHHLKLATPLLALGHPLESGPVARLCDDLLPLCDNGRFRLNADTDASYSHAACYAAEGCMALVEAGHPTAWQLVRRCAEWLASVQAKRGGIPAWHDGVRAQGELRSDATAQAVRIWIRTDPDRFRTSIERGLSFLATLQSASGGIRYSEYSEDSNTWTTAFTVQALGWRATGSADLPVV